MEPEHARELLASRRAEIEGKLPGLRTREGPEDAEDPFDSADVAPELVEAGLTSALAEQLRDELDAIERAERRLAEGTYGLSVESGEPIPDGRLEAVPWAERTASEQARYEQSRR
jgi:DnaK suppressor protein